jgi:hypothetical protein
MLCLVALEGFLLRCGRFFCTNPSSGYNRYTRCLLTCQPSRCKSTDLPVPVTNPRLCDLAYPYPRLGPGFLVALLAIRATHDQQHPARMPLAGPIVIA